MDNLKINEQKKTRYSTFNRGSLGSATDSLKKQTLDKVQMSQGTLTDSMKDLRQKMIKEQELKRNINIMNFNNQKYTYVQLDTDMHQSIFTDNNPNFQACVQMIKNYNKDIQQCKILGKEMEDGPWKNTFYGTLQAQLWEVRFNKDRTLQSAYIDKIYEWAQYQIKCADKTKIHNAVLDLESNTKNFKNLTVKKRNVRSVTGQTNQSQGGNSTLNTTQLPNQTMMEDSINKHLRGQSTESNQKGQIRLQSVQNTQNILDEQDEDIQSLKQDSKTLPFLKSQKKIIPNEQIKDSLKDYELKFRTKHPDIDPPSIRLEAYKKKAITNDKQILEIQEVTKMEGGVVYPMPQNYLPQPEIDDLQDDEGNEEGDGDGGDQDEGDEGDDGQSNDPKQDLLEGMDDLQLIGNQPAEDEKDGQGAIVPKIKNYTNDKIANIDIESKNINKQFELKSNYVHYVPSDNQAEARMELKWAQNRQKELNDKRQEEEIVQMINQWGITKGRMEKEINRKYESKKFGSCFQECEYRPKKWQPKELKKLNEKLLRTEEEERRRKQEKIDRQQKLIDEQNNSTQKSETQVKKNTRGIRSQSLQTQSNKVTFNEGQLPKIQVGTFTRKLQTSGIERQINQQKIKQVKAQYGQLIGLQRYKPKPEDGEENEDEDESASESVKIVCQPSLSVYTRPISTGYRPFSSVLDMVDKDKLREQQLQEIQVLKNRLAKNKINVPMKVLMDSIVIPPEKINVPKEDTEILQSGQQLFSNDFWPVAKKKGGKKKKKR